MSEINNNGYNPEVSKIQKQTHVNNSANILQQTTSTEKQQTDASAPVTESLGKSMVRVDNHEADMQRLLQNPKIAEVSDKMFNAATNAGLNYTDAATFATTEA